VRTVALRKHGDPLNDHVFATERDGREWMSQKWKPAESGFVLWEVEATDAPCRCCGRANGLRVTKWLAPAEKEGT